MSLNCLPLIIIGAPRSGTNILRDVITSMPGYSTWPCDEINPVWRHGNVFHPNDVFGEEQVNEKARTYIRRAFQRRARQDKARYVVEKTCANTLRVPFINKILPEARFIHIVRDGRDATVSAMKRWCSSIDIRYTLKKARYVPVSDLPVYGASFLVNRLRQFVSSEKKLLTWGPRFEGIEDLVRSSSLAEVCAWQWRACVDTADDGFEKVEKEHVFRLYYEDFVNSPREELERLKEFYQLDADIDMLSTVLSRVTPSSVGNWREAMHDEGMSRVIDILEPALRRHGYQL